MAVFLVPLGAFLLALLLTPASMVLARRWQLVDRPGGRRKHRGVVPRLGGLALFCSFAGGLLLARWLGGSDLDPPAAEVDVQRWLGLLLGGAFVTGFGLLDDRHEFGSGPQYMAQVAAAVLSVVFLIAIERVENPFGAGEIIFSVPVAWLLTIGWFVVAINTVNWLDGVDGLATTVAAVVAVVLAVHMLRTGQQDSATMALALCGCTLGFLAFNWPPARVFMGSAGSYFLGYVLAALGLVAGARVATVLLVIGLPVLDAAWLVWWRWRHGQPVGRGDRNHLHHRLIDKGYGQRQIVLGYAAFCAVFGVIGLMASTTVSKLLALAALVLLGGFVLRWAAPE